MATLSYPPARHGDVVDDHHGEKVPDPYRWMEDPDDPETVAWVAAENALTRQVLDAAPGRVRIKARITELWDYPKFGVPFERGGRWFQTRNPGLQSQPVVYVSEDPGAPGRVLLDPNSLSPDGTAALTGLSVTDDGNLVAYAVSESGSDWMTWRVRDVDSGSDRDDAVHWSKFCVAEWRRDGSGFFYSGLDEPPAGVEYVNESRDIRVRFHRLGTDQAVDPVVYECPEQPDWIPRGAVSDDDRYLLISINRGTARQNRLLVKDLTEADADFVPLADDFSRKAWPVANDGPRFLLQTDAGAERGKVVAAELGGGAWVDVVPESGDTLVEAQACGGKLLCHYLHDAHSVVRVFELDGSPLGAVPIPEYVSLVAEPLSHGTFEGRRESDLVHFKVVSFVESGALWSYNTRDGRAILREPSASPLDVSQFETEQVFVESEDGTRVPMFLTRRRDLMPNGSVPSLLYGYGGFEIPMTPSFTVTFAAWLDRGGLLAVANLRGGGEYGKAWHDAGRLDRKQNVFDDFSACARWLAGSGWSRSDRVAIWGGSNGGLLVGASITQRPELFGAAVADVGVFDMLRFDKFTIGWAWKSDYGDPDDPEQYQTLRAYSPLHNVREGACYPPTLLMTGDHDDRVVPGHSLKFAATLQAAQACDAPVLLRVETSAGHGLGKPTGKLIDEAADRVAFIDWALGAS